MNAYQYADLLKQALKTESQEDLQALADWMDAYDSRSWNGEAYNLDNGMMLYKIFDPDNDWDAYDNGDLDGDDLKYRWEVR